MGSVLTSTGLATADTFLQVESMDRQGRTVMWVLAFLIIFGTTKSFALASGSCSWDCTPIKECKVIYRDLVAAKIAREKQENWKVEKIISLIRGYTCDQKAEQVCCPEFMGQFNNTLTNTVNMVYAINSDTIVIRSSMEHSSWSNTETFFWREKSCFPSLEYKVDLEFNDLETEEENFEEEKMVLPATLSVEDIRCMSVWTGDTEVGSAHLSWPRRTPKAG